MINMPFKACSVSKSATAVAVAALLTLSPAALTAALSGDYSSYQSINSNLSAARGKTAALKMIYVHKSKKRQIFITTDGGSIYMFGATHLNFSSEKTYRILFKITGKHGASLKGQYIKHETAR